MPSSSQRQGDGVAEEPLGEELQRHLPAEAGVLSLVDDTHAPAAQLLQDAVVRNGLADHGAAFSFAGTAIGCSSSADSVRFLVAFAA